MFSFYDLNIKSAKFLKLFFCICIMFVKMIATLIVDYFHKIRNGLHEPKKKCVETYMLNFVTLQYTNFFISL